MSTKDRRRTLTAPEDLPGPAILPISGLSKESRAYLDVKQDPRPNDEPGAGGDEGASTKDR